MRVFLHFGNKIISANDEYLFGENLYGRTFMLNDGLDTVKVSVVRVEDMIQVSGEACDFIKNVYLST